MFEVSLPSELAAEVVEFCPWVLKSSSEARPHQQEQPNTSRFSIINLDDIEIGDDPIWIIDGLLPATGFGIVFGLPKSGKSFLLSDALFHVALGRPWAGRHVRQGAVLYITGEGVSGFKRRLVAMRRHYGVEGQGVPFGIITVAPDFGHASGDAEELIKLIKVWLDSVGNPPLGAIALDTLARAMKGADENLAKDMTTFVDNCGKLGDAFNCLVLGVHHAGKDIARGSRGSNALDGAVDVMWSVEKGEESSTAAIHHMKDGEEGLSWQFRLAPYVLAEATETKSATTTCVVETVTDPVQAKQAKHARNKKLGKSQTMLLSIIREAMSEAGGSITGYPTVPPDAKAMPRETLKRYLPLKGYWDTDKPSAANRATFSRDLKEISQAGYIGLTAEHLWLINR
jgi:hypothetical protein